MTATIFFRNQVKDFDAWKKVFDSGAEFIKGKGVTASRVLQDLDNPNLVIVCSEFADASKAKAFVALVNSDTFRKGDSVTKGGVLLETMEMWLGEEV